MIRSGEKIRRAKMDNLKAELWTSFILDPADFDGREALWMAREDLRAEEDHAKSV